MGLGAGLVGGGTGSLLNELSVGHDRSAWAAGPVADATGVLVVLCMFGGNDGLNTVVPRTTVATTTSTAAGGARQPGAADRSGEGSTRILTEFKRLWDLGQMAVVDGIGYPNPNLSHFTSMAYWMAGQPSGRQARAGSDGGSTTTWRTEGPLRGGRDRERAPVASGRQRATRDSGAGGAARDRCHL